MTEIYTFPTQQVVDGKLVNPPPEICPTVAGRVFQERKDADTNPKIVQMKLRGELVRHWYFRSDQWVEQPYLNENVGLLPYIGPAKEAPASLYGKGTYFVDEQATKDFGTHPRKITK